MFFFSLWITHKCHLSSLFPLVRGMGCIAVITARCSPGWRINHEPEPPASNAQRRNTKPGKVCAQNSHQVLNVIKLIRFLESILHRWWTDDTNYCLLLCYRRSLLHLYLWKKDENLLRGTCALDWQTVYLSLLGFLYLISMQKWRKDYYYSMGVCVCVCVCVRACARVRVCVVVAFMKYNFRVSVCQNSYKKNISSDHI